MFNCTIFVLYYLINIKIKIKPEKEECKTKLNPKNEKRMYPEHTSYKIKTTRKLQSNKNRIYL
jgi:hypothetical protein